MHDALSDVRQLHLAGCTKAARHRSLWSSDNRDVIVQPLQREVLARVLDKVCPLRPHAL